LLGPEAFSLVPASTIGSYLVLPSGLGGGARLQWLLLMLLSPASNIRIKANPKLTGLPIRL